MNKKIIKSDDTEIEEYQFHQHKRSVSINDISIQKQHYLISFPLINKILNNSLVTNMMKNEYSVQKIVYMEEILIKLNDDGIF